MRNITGIPKKEYRYIFIAQNRNYWASRVHDYDKTKDLVLTFDFGVLRSVIDSGGTAAFADHLEDPGKLQEYNFAVYDFFRKWNYGPDGRDIFEYNGYNIGDSVRLEIWNELVYYVRVLANFHPLKNIKYQKVFVGSDDAYLLEILALLGISHEKWEDNGQYDLQEYYFPIFRWLQEALHPEGIKYEIKKIIRQITDEILLVTDRLGVTRKFKKDIYVQSYYPTRPIIDRLKDEARFSVILDYQNIKKDLTRERSLPAWRSASGRYTKEVKRMIGLFKSKAQAKLNVCGLDIEDRIFELFLNKISKLLPDYLKYTHCLERFFKHRKVCLAVPMANVGAANCLVLGYCKKKGIKSYLISNGLLMNEFMFEAKDADWINSYGESVKNNYFKRMKNIVCLGDPRMDEYQGFSKTIDRENPVIMIGTAGYCSVDLNSFVACDFEFLFETMTALSQMKASGKKMKVVLRVRTDGYTEIYSKFMEEYFPGFEIEYRRGGPFREVVKMADLYISIGSQTLFEASCSGIPVIYYKNDTQIQHPPFDGGSELVTAYTVDSLKEKIELFYKNDGAFEKFLDRKVMEKYVGPLDGNNLKRNMDFIYSLASGKEGA